MNLNKAKGQIQRFFTIDPVDKFDKTPSYSTLQGLYHEEKSSDDG